MLDKQELITHLLRNYTPEVILLGGSRAKNAERASSDWDLYLIGNYTVKNEQCSEQFLGEHLDIALFPKSSLNGNVLRLFYGPVSDLKVLLDNEKCLGSQIVNNTRDAYAKKPNHLSTIQVKNKLNYLYRILSKIDGYKDTPEIYFFHLAQFYQTIIPYWFEFHSEWSVPAHYAIPIIKSRDSEFYKLLESLVNTSETQNQLITCQKIVDYYKSKSHQ